MSDPLGQPYIENICLFLHADGRMDKHDIATIATEVGQVDQKYNIQDMCHQ